MATQDASEDEDCPFCQIASKQTDTDILFSVSVARSSCRSIVVVISSFPSTGSRAAVLSWRQTRRRASFAGGDQDAHRQLQDAAGAPRPSGWATRQSCAWQSCACESRKVKAPESLHRGQCHRGFPPHKSLLQPTAALHKSPRDESQCPTSGGCFLSFFYFVSGADGGSREEHSGEE